MQLFLDIINIVLPVFLVIGLGYLLQRIRLIDQPFLLQTNRLVFYVCLPLLLFYKIGQADFVSNFNLTLVIGSILVIVLVFVAAYVWGLVCKYPPAVRGSFTQAAFRCNLAYMGLAIVFNAYGDEGLTRAGILMGFLVPVLNLFAILALTLPHRQHNRSEPSIWLRQLALNPLIIASFAGILWSFLKLPLPLVLDRGLKIATGMTLPLALLAIGGSFSLARLKGDLYQALTATGFKTVLMPLMAALLLFLLGVRGMDLGIGILFAGAPSATANFIMAQQLKGDAELAGSTVMLSTLFSAVTYTIALLLLRSYAA
jgi:malate permease and related proteins